MVTYILNKIHSIISSVLYKIGVVFMSLMTLAVLIQVLMRYVFSSPISWIEEFCIYSMFLMTFLLAPYIALKKMNISMTLFYDKIKNIKAKMIINNIIKFNFHLGIYTVYPSMMEVVLNNINVNNNPNAPDQRSILPDSTNFFFYGYYYIYRADIGRFS